MREKANPMLVTFEDLPKEKRWDACLKALRTEYTLTFKDMCRALKCSRSWAARYLKPHLHYIYLSNGAGKSPDYVKAARKRLLNSDMSESTWYSRKEFEELIRSHITQVTRQTINIPIEYLIVQDRIENFKEKYAEWQQDCEDIKKQKDYLVHLKRRDIILEEYASTKGKRLWNNAPSKYKRTMSPAVECNIGNIRIEDLCAVHDLKDYGDSDEEIYRDLFEQGCYRAVLRLQDTDGEESEKIYYLHPDDEFDIKDSIEMVLVNYADYLD